MNGSKASPRGRAVVVGASIAGLLAARILSANYREVILLDRDSLPDGPVVRKSVPQEHHVHLLLQRGQLILERLMPGLMQELASEGAMVVDLGADIACFQGDRWKRRWRTGITAPYCTRTLVEHILRRTVAAIPNVTIRQGVSVEGLIFDENDAVSGVQLSRGAVAIQLEGDLVIDASGRGSSVAQWIESAGYPPVQRSELVTRLGYVSGVYEPPKDLARNWKVLLCLPKVPIDRRMAVVSPIEGGRWMVTAGAWFDEQPEPTECALLDYLQALPIPHFHTTVSRATLVGRLHRYRMRGGLRRHFERLSRWPQNLLVIGDAVASINPLYSQGMTASALQAEALSLGIANICEGKVGHRDLQARICEAVDAPWAQAASMEQRFLNPEGSRKLRDLIRTAYLDHLIAASAEDRSVALALLKVNNLIAKPNTLFRPSLAIRSFASSIQANAITGLSSNEQLYRPAPSYRI